MKKKLMVLAVFSMLILVIFSSVVNGNKVEKNSLINNIENQDQKYEGSKYLPITTLNMLPESYDLREEIDMPPVEDQGLRGTCWAMAAIAAFEILIKKNTGYEVDLAEQWMIRCADDGTDDRGTGGISGFEALSYFGRSGFSSSQDYWGDSGAVLESEISYWDNENCNGPYPHRYVLDDWGYVDDAHMTSVADVETIQQAIYDYGPIVSGVFAGNWWDPINPWSTGFAWKWYDGRPESRLWGPNLDPNHAVVIVGWNGYPGDSEGYWIIRNSWLYTPWGEWGDYWGQDENGNCDGNSGGYAEVKYETCSIGYGPCYLEYSGDSLDAELVIKKKVQGSLTQLSSGDIIRPDDQITFIGNAKGGVSRYLYDLDPDEDGYSLGNTKKTYDEDYVISRDYQYGENAHGNITVKLKVRDYLSMTYDSSNYDDIDYDEFYLIVNRPPDTPTCEYSMWTYAIKANDDDGDDIYFEFERKDGGIVRYPSGSGYVKSGKTHEFETRDDFKRVKACDKWEESGWQTEDDSDAISNNLLLKLLGRNILLENIFSRILSMFPGYVIN